MQEVTDQRDRHRISDGPTVAFDAVAVELEQCYTDNEPAGALSVRQSTMNVSITLRRRYIDDDGMTTEWGSFVVTRFELYSH